MTVRRFDGVEAVPEDLGPAVATVGMFDGVHRGHRALLDRVAAEAAARGLPAAAVTFDRHPLAVLRPGSEPPLLTTLDRKVELLGAAGMDVVLVLAFTRELSQVGAEVFAAEVLFDALAARAVVVGENFRFGHKAAGDPALLAELGRPRGIEVVAVPLHTDGDQVVSSTRVRAELAEGDVAAAAASLGRPYAVEGEVVVGDRRGRPLLGVPTANLAVPAGIALPADGVYAGHLTDDADGIARPAAISVGTNPQFGTDRRVEAHVLDFDADLYGHQVSVGFTHHLRGQATFAGVDELVAQMRADIDQARRLLPSPPGGTVRTGGFSRPTP
ncbi:MAG TPA: bifunctional riboflavin kinase/FAD synthetase [Actinomycetota bacterium]|nr:bifunctional riboflavin kinase/FAD synthetase [Actinomycetota bacterium]